jgi:hypothetical protein
MSDLTTRFTCTECPWTETVAAVGVAAAELAAAHHPDHVIVRAYDPSPRLRRRRRPARAHKESAE